MDHSIIEAVTEALLAEYVARAYDDVSDEEYRLSDEDDLADQFSQVTAKLSEDDGLQNVAEFNRLIDAAEENVSEEIDAILKDARAQLTEKIRIELNLRRGR